MDLDDLFALRLYFQDQYEDENDIIKELKYELVNQGLSEEDANNKLKEFYNTYGIDIDINIFEEIETPEDNLPELILNNNPFLNLLQNNNTFANLLNNNQGNNPFANLLNNNQGNNPFANLLNNNQGNIIGNLITQLQQLQTNNPGNNSINNLLNQLQQLQNNNQENNNPNSIFILLNQLYQQHNHDNNEDDNDNNEDDNDNNEHDNDNNEDDNDNNEHDNDNNEDDTNNNLPNIFLNPSQNEINNLAALLLAGFNIAPPPPQDVICTLDETDKEKLSKYILTEDHTEKCNICLDLLATDQEVIKLPCEHIYHSECILEWLDKYNYKCPCCRNEVGKAKYSV